MIPFHALLGLLPPVALTLVRPSIHSGSAPLPEESRKTVLEHLRQIKADLGGDPLLAEEIYRIVNSPRTP
jgi:hypothetical protein